MPKHIVHSKIMTHPRLEARLQLPDAYCIVDRSVIDEFNAEVERGRKAEEHVRQVEKEFSKIFPGLFPAGGRG